MPESDKVRVELELPREQVHIEPADEAFEPAAQMPEEPSGSPEQRLQELKKKLEQSKEVGNKETGVKPQTLEMIKSAVAPLDNLPAVQDTSPPNSHQKVTIMVGFGFALLGFALWPLSSFMVAVAVALVGAVIITAGTFVKV